MREIKFKGFNPKSEYRDEAEMSEPFRVGSALSERGWDVLLQFTGLYDKNGKEIYEGDIVRVRHCDEYDNVFYTGVMAWQNEWVLMVDNEPLQVWDDGLHNWYGIINLIDEYTEVIGNVHQNPELLK